MLNPSVKGYVLYFYNVEHLESELIPLTSIPPSIMIKKTQELFSTEKIAFFLSGKPVIILKRGSHISVELKFELEKTKGEFMDKKETKEVLKEIGMSSFEQQKLFGSTAFQSVFRKNIISFATLMTVIAISLISVLITMLIYSMIIIPTIEVEYITEYIYIPYNETITNSTVRLLLSCLR